MSEASTVYETRCERCRVSFPPDTRQCFYCGNRLGPGPASLVAGLPPVLEPDPEEGPQVRRPLAMRGVITLFWLLFAVAVTLFRFCAERP